MDSRNRFDLINELQGKIHACLADCITDDPIAILDYPDIKNVGDAAIWLGEIAYLDKHHGRSPAYVSTIHNFSPADLERAAPAGPIFIHGGGTFGDIWALHQDFREEVLARWPNRRIVHFPQSIHFNSADRADQAARAIAAHKDFILLVRDEESKDFAERKFDCQVRLCPDMAFFMGPLEERGRPEFPVLAMLRGDKESTGDYDPADLQGIPVDDWISESRSAMRLRKLWGAAKGLAGVSPGGIRGGKYDEAAIARLERGVRKLSRGRAVVTDRLHVHIISLLLGKPHAVLDNSYGKIRRFMSAFSGGSELSYPARSLADAVAWARARSDEKR